MGSAMRVYGVTSELVTPEICDLTRRVMTTVLDIGVPLDVSIGTGDTWLEAH